MVELNDKLDFCCLITLNYFVGAFKLCFDVFSDFSLEMYDWVFLKSKMFWPANQKISKSILLYVTAKLAKIAWFVKLTFLSLENSFFQIKRCSKWHFNPLNNSFLPLEEKFTPGLIFFELLKAPKNTLLWPFQVNFNGIWMAIWTL